VGTLAKLKDEMLKLKWRQPHKLRKRRARHALSTGVVVEKDREEVMIIKRDGTPVRGAGCVVAPGCN
jgi:hypothetical protein